MSELLFGSGGPMWTGLPAQGFGWPQPFPALGNPLSQGVSGLAPQPPVAPMLNPAGLISTASPYASTVLGADFPLGPNVLGLLATVAMRRGQPMGPTNDQEIEDFIYDVLELLPAARDVEVRCEGGRVTLTGSVQHKRVKRDLGEVAWAIPGVNDVQNNLSITSRRRPRAVVREAEPAPARKQA